jgi:hypothetical protein
MVQENLGAVVTPERSRWTHGLMHGVHVAPAECLKQGNGWLFNELVFGVAARA